MKIILAAMAAVIVILAVAVGAAFMGKVDILIQEEPTRTAPNSKPAFTGDENRQRQSQNQQEDDGSSPKIAFVSESRCPDPGYLDTVCSEIYVMNADGSGQTNLTNNPADDQSPNRAAGTHDST
jgi:hypothetical protein